MIVSGSPGASEEPVVPRAISVVLQRKWLILAFLATGVFGPVGEHPVSTAMRATDAAAILPIRPLRVWALS